MSDRAQRRLPCGVEIVNGGVHARVWAPACKRVDVVIEGSDDVIISSGKPTGTTQA